MSSLQSSDKPFLSLSDQILLLQNRNLTINNQNSVADALLRFGYYQIINGYGAPFETKDNGDKLYNDGITFEDIYRQFLLDRDLISIITPNIINIEQHLETVIAYFIAEKFGVISDITSNSSYLNKQNYNFKNGTFKTLDYVIKTMKTTPDKPTSWYRKHKNHVPPWILFSNLTFGQVTNFYKIIPRDIQKDIVSRFIPNKLIKHSDFFKTNFFIYLELLRIFRNKGSHGSVFSSNKFTKYNLRIGTRLSGANFSLFSNTKFEKQGYGDGDFYSFLIVLLIFVNSKEIAIFILDNLRRTINLNLQSIDKPGTIDKKASAAFHQISNLPKNYYDALLDLINTIY